MESNNKIKDITLADWGRKEIELAEVEMPGLMACREEFGTKKPFHGARISGSLHMTIQTAVLIETLHHLGAKVRWCSCNIYSTQDHAASAIVKAGTANVFAWKGETLQEYWDLTLDCISWPDGQGPQLIVDDGGDATLLIILGLEAERKLADSGVLPVPERGESEDERCLLATIKKSLEKDPQFFSKVSKDLKGVSEETTTGVHRLYKLQQEGRLPFPAINVNDSVTKSKFDNVYGCKHSLPDGLNRATDVMLAGKKVMIFGYGDVGKGSAAALAGCGSRVFVAEIDPICALQACMQGYEVKKIDSVLSDIDIFITATGNKMIITAEHMSKMKNNAIVGNIGHFDNEIDMEGLKKWPGIQKINIKPQVDRWVFPDGHGIIILAEGTVVVDLGRLLNLGCATGHPSFVMSNSFTNQVLAQLELWSNVETKKYGNEVYKLPKHLDEKVARLHLKSLGAELTILTEDQSKYIHIDVNGPYKTDYYKY